MAIEKVVYLEKGDLSVNQSRRITTIINGTNEFDTTDVRLIVVDATGELGGHYREYPEVWGFLGVANVTLEDIKTKERRIYKATDGTRIFIPAMVASKVEAEKGTAIVTCSPRSDREKQTHKYELWLIK